MTPEYVTSPEGAETLHLVGIDVGGTKTHLRAVDTHGVEYDEVIPSSQWRIGSLFSDPGNITRLGEQVRSLGVVDAHTVIAAGIHGCDTEEQMRAVEDILSEQLGARTVVVNDALLLRYAAGLTRSLEMIVGTGAIASGTLASGERITVDGYGWPLGDRGSAHDLVGRAIQWVLRTSDKGAELADPLYAAIMNSFGAHSAVELAEIATEQAGGASWGSHAAEVFAAAQAGSAAAHTLIDDAAAALADGVRLLIQRGVDSHTVVAGGGVIVHQESYEQAIRAHLARLAPQAELIVVRVPPVHGAVALAQLTASTTVRSLP